MTSGAIANVHTIFRLSTAVLLLPVCGQFEKLSRVLVRTISRSARTST